MIYIRTRIIRKENQSAALILFKSKKRLYGTKRKISQNVDRKINKMKTKMKYKVYNMTKKLNRIAFQVVISIYLSIIIIIIRCANAEDNKWHMAKSW